MSLSTVNSFLYLLFATLTLYSASTMSCLSSALSRSFNASLYSLNDLVTALSFPYFIDFLLFSRSLIFCLILFIFSLPIFLLDDIEVRVSIFSSIFFISSFSLLALAIFSEPEVLFFAISLFIFALSLTWRTIAFSSSDSIFIASDSSISSSPSLDSFLLIPLVRLADSIISDEVLSAIAFDTFSNLSIANAFLSLTVVSFSIAPSGFRISDISVFNAFISLLISSSINSSSKPLYIEFISSSAAANSASLSSSFFDFSSAITSSVVLLIDFPSFNAPETFMNSSSSFLVKNSFLNSFSVFSAIFFSDIGSALVGCSISSWSLLSSILLSIVVSIDPVSVVSSTLDSSCLSLFPFSVSLSPVVSVSVVAPLSVSPVCSSLAVSIVVSSVDSFCSPLIFSVVFISSSTVKSVSVVS